MEANVIKCPNCGASSSNHTNCEYCGSLLVRFVDKGIDLSTTSYLTNDFVYEGIIDALKHNLERQELNPGKMITTDICYKSSSTVKLSRKRHGVAVVGRTGSAHWNDGDNIKLGEGETGLVIKFSFDVVADGEDAGGNRIQNQYEKFQKLSSLPLFTHHTGIYMRPGSSNRFRCREYAIDFGQDYEGAARLISEVLDKVYEIPHDGKLTCLAEDDEVKPMEQEELQEEIEQKGYSIGQKIGIAFSIICLLALLSGTVDNGGIFSSILILSAIVFAIYVALKHKEFNGILLPIMFVLLTFSFFVLMMSTCAAQDEEAEQLIEKWKQEEQQKAPEKAKSDVEQKVKPENGSKTKSIAEEAYSDGVNNAYKSGSVEIINDLIRSGYTKSNIRGTQMTQGRLNYKEKYGKPQNSEEEELMELYAEKFAEGFMKTMFKD